MNKSITKNLVLTSLFAAITAVLAQIAIPIGPVPFSLGIMGAFLAGLMLKPIWAFGSMLLYITIGAIGIPVFASFGAGATTLFGKTGGYLLGYMAISFIIALSYKIKNKLWCIAIGMAVGLIICYAIGTIWFMFLTNSDLFAALSLCVFPFIIPDIMKAVFSYYLAAKIKKRLSAVMK
ncbi:MAG: biotin transporter BioY [Oscillospiraceae bacterium]